MKTNKKAKIKQKNKKLTQDAQLLPLSSMYDSSHKRLQRVYQFQSRNDLIILRQLHWRQPLCSECILTQPEPQAIKFFRSRTKNVHTVK